MSTLPRLDYNDLFKLSDPLATRPLRLTPEGCSDWLSGEQAIALFKGELCLEQPLKLRAYMGGQATDFLWCGLSAIRVVSERLVTLLQEHAFTGWATYPVEVYGRKGEALPGYYGFSVTGRGGERDRSRSQIITKPPPAPGGQSYQVYKGLYFDESGWDGSDIFLVWGGIVVTRPVREAFKRAKIINVRFTALPEVEIDVFLDRYDKQHPSSSL